MNHNSLKNLLGYLEAYPLKEGKNYYLIIDGMDRVFISSQDSEFQVREYIPPVNSENIYLVLADFFTKEIAKYELMLGRFQSDNLASLLEEAKNNLALVKGSDTIEELEDLILEYPD